MNEKVKNLEKSIDRFSKKDFTVMFFVVDTKGRPNGSIAYIYETAYALKEAGYNVKILHAEKEFVGVESWLGEKYASLPHEAIDKNTTLTVSPSDFLFIQEVHASALSATKQLPCKRVVILQNFSYLEDTCPMGVSFDDLKIRDCIVTTQALSERVKAFFPDVHTDIVPRSIPSYFTKGENKKLVINILTGDQNVVNAVIKPFYWKYPQYKWVAFRPIPNNLEREEFAKALQEGFATLWCDDKSDFGQNAAEAMASGSLIIGKIPENYSELVFDEVGSIRDNGLWFFNPLEACDMIASAIQSFLTDTIPAGVGEKARETAAAYTEERTKEAILKVYPEIFERRKAELEKILDYYKKNETEEK